MIAKLKDINDLVLFEHTIFSLPFIFIAMIVAANGFFGWKLLVLGVLATIFARNFAMAFNRLVDKRFDALNPRTKNRPSVDGRLTTPQMVGFIVLNGISFVVVAYFINHLAFLLSIPILAILATYSYIKRFSALAHLFLGFSLALAPLAGSIAVLETIPIWAIFLAIGVLFWVAGFDILYAILDIEFDKKMGLYSIPSRFGKERAKKISRLFHLITIKSWALFVIFSNGGVFSYIGLIFAFLLLAYEHYLVYKSESNINRAFFTVNGYLGIIFLGFIVLDRSVY